MTEVDKGSRLYENLPRIEGITLTGEPVIGSVQVLYPVRYDGMTESGLVARATDGGSVFDVGTIFEIPESGAARNTLRHRTFTEMADPQTWQDMTAQDFAACFSDPAQVERLLTSPALARFRSAGAPTHHVGIVDRATGQVITEPTDIWSDLVLVRKFPVIKPGRAALLGTLVYDYHDYARADSKVMPS